MCTTDINSLWVKKDFGNCFFSFTLSPLLGCCSIWPQPSDTVMVVSAQQSYPPYHGTHNYVELLLYPTYKSQKQMVTSHQRMHSGSHRLRLRWCIETKVFPRCFFKLQGHTYCCCYLKVMCHIFILLKAFHEVYEHHQWYVWQSIRKYYKPNSSFMSSMK